MWGVIDLHHALSLPSTPPTQPQALLVRLSKVFRHRPLVPKPQAQDIIGMWGLGCDAYVGGVVVVKPRCLLHGLDHVGVSQLVGCTSRSDCL